MNFLREIRNGALLKGGGKVLDFYISQILDCKHLFINNPFGLDVLTNEEQLAGDIV